MAVTNAEFERKVVIARTHARTYVHTDGLVPVCTVMEATEWSLERRAFQIQSVNVQVSEL